MKYISSLLLILVSIFLSSCTEYYFSKPQPIDVDNTYLVPQKYIGTWRIEDKDGSIDSIFITENYYKRITRTTTKESKKVIESDSNVYLINNKIYSKENGDLEGGYNYKIIGDSIMIDLVLIETIEFGSTAFFRKINYGFIFNQKHDKMNDWWNIKFIDTRNKEVILIKNLTGKDLEGISDYKILHDDFSNYLIVNWSSKYFENFIDKGGFSDTTLMLNYKDRIKQTVK